MKRFLLIVLIRLLDGLSNFENQNDIAIKIFQEGERLESDGEFLAAGDAFYVALTNGYPNLATGFERFQNTFVSRGKGEYAYYVMGRGYEAQNDMKNAKLMFRRGMDMSTSLSRIDFVNALQSDGTRTNKIMEYRDLYARANEYLRSRRYDASLKLFEKLTRMRPDVTYFYATLVYLRSRVCKWSEYHSNMLRLEGLLSTDLNLIRNMKVIPKFPIAEPHMLLAMPISPMLKLEIARHRADDEMRRVRSKKMIPYTLRVGFISADFRMKATSYLILRMFRYFDRLQFEIFAFATSPDSSDQEVRASRVQTGWREILRNDVEHFVDFSNLTSSEMAREIHDRYKIDILVDMDGFSNNGIRADMIFPLQPAPIQVNMLVYVGTLGASWIQYVVADDVSVTKSTEKFMQEKIIRLPQSFFVNSHMHIPELSASSSSSSVVERNYFRFCNFNKHLKFSPAVFRAWMEILTRLPTSRLVLLHNPPESESFLREHVEVAYNGIDRKRLEFLDFTESPYEHQHRIETHCDLILDNPIYNAHTMAVDALWGGVPVLTWGNGLDMGGRVGVSILTTLLPPTLRSHLVATDDEDYISKAVRVASDKILHAKLRDALLQGGRSCSSSSSINRFWNTSLYVHYLERGFQAIWRRYRSGLNPDHIRVPDVHKDDYCIVGSESDSLLDKEEVCG